MTLEIEFLCGSSSVQLGHLVKVLSFNTAFILPNEVMKRSWNERQAVCEEGWWKFNETESSHSAKHFVTKYQKILNAETCLMGNQVMNLICDANGQTLWHTMWFFKDFREILKHLLIIFQIGLQYVDFPNWSFQIVIDRAMHVLVFRALFRSRGIHSFHWVN